MKRPPLSLLPVLLLPLAAFAVGAAPKAPDLPPTVVTADDLESQSSATETTTYFTGHVVATGNDIRLTCDKLKVISNRVGDKTDTIGTQSKFKYLLATGHVYIVSAEREAACGRAEVLPSEEKITLTENPVVTDRENGSVATGDELVMLKKEEKVTGKNVRMVMPPIKDLGFHSPGTAADGTPTPPAPAAEIKSP
jgi:lipopolysaccharide export system protein LptA